MLIGLEFQGSVVVGVCSFPSLGEIVYAAEGGGAWHRRAKAPPKQVHVSRISNLSEALFCFTEIAGWEQTGRKDCFRAMRQATRVARGWGDCYGHMLVATGRAEVMVDPQLNPWDAAPLLPILQEAGGHFLDWEGRPSIHSGNGFSVNGALKDEVLAILQSAPTVH
jgi:fructose-1,6-bisphosphatase/inositol monophosphatase family enzyme